MAYSTIPTGFIDTFEKNIRHQIQQMPSRLRSALDQGRIVGEYLYMDSLGTLSMHERLTRNGDTVNDDTSWEKRRIHLRSFYTAPLQDKFDEIMLGRDPKSKIVQATVAAANRKIDDIIIGAFSADVESGRDGSGTLSYDSGNTITCGSGLTVAKLLELARTMDENELIDETERYIVLSPQEKAKLLSEATFTSQDYVPGKPLPAWELPPFAGFNFIVTNRLTTSGSTRYCWAFVKPAMQFGIGEDITTYVDRLPAKEQNWQIFTEISFNVLRVFEEGVYRLDVSTT